MLINIINLVLIAYRMKKNAAKLYRNFNNWFILFYLFILKYIELYYIIGIYQHYLQLL